MTHDQEEAMTMASRIAVMSEGYFLQIGAPDEIYETPNSRQVADFIGNVNMFEGKWLWMSQITSLLNVMSVRIMLDMALLAIRAWR